MAGGVHPRGHNGIGARIAHGDVFAGIVVGDAEGLHHVEGRAVGGAGVAEVAVVVHVLGFDGGIAAERVVKLERRKAVCCALAVDESQDLLGVVGADGQELGWQTDGGQGMQTLCPKQNVRLRVVQVGDAACAEMISAAESARVDTNVKIFLFIGFPSLLFFLRQCVVKGKL